MATRIAWYLNLDADLELRDADRYRTSRLPSHRVAELSARMADLIAPGDVILDAARPVPDPSSTSAVACVQAFCPTPSALLRIEELGFVPPAAPGVSILREVNDRKFCAGLGHGLAGSCFALDMATLERHLQATSPATTYVLKRAFSFAGREQRRVTGGRLDPSTRGFCLRSFARGEGLQVEPWVERLADFSRHGYLTRAGNLSIGPVREQRCDPMGRFLGMSAAKPRIEVTEDELLAVELRKTALALTRAGYFGPFGIDGFRYRQAGGVGFDARCEINARFTMGYPRELLLAGLAGE